MDPNDVYLSGKTAQNQRIEPVEENNIVEYFPPENTETEVNLNEGTDLLKEDAPKKEITTASNPQKSVKNNEAPKITSVQTKPKVAQKQELKTPVLTIQPVNQTKPRWDVQIGGFKVKEGALALHNKAKTEGYDVYMIDSVKDGQPFYRVRVIGYETKESTAKLAVKLQAVGYPTYLVSVK